MDYLKDLFKLKNKKIDKYEIISRANFNTSLREINSNYDEDLFNKFDESLSKREYLLRNHDEAKKFVKPVRMIDESLEKYMVRLKEFDEDVNKLIDNNKNLVGRQHLGKVRRKTEEAYWKNNSAQEEHMRQKIQFQNDLVQESKKEGYTKNLNKDLNKKLKEKRSRVNSIIGQNNIQIEEEKKEQERILKQQQEEQAQARILKQQQEARLKQQQEARLKQQEQEQEQTRILKQREEINRQKLEKLQQQEQALKQQQEQALKQQQEVELLVNNSAKREQDLINKFWEQQQIKDKQIKEQQRQQINLEPKIDLDSENKSKHILLDKDSGNQRSPLDVQGSGVQGPRRLDRALVRTRAGWTTTKNACAKFWNHPLGKTTIIMTGIVATYAIVSSIVKASSSVQMSGKTRVMPFNNTSSGIYNKDIDDRLKFVTAAVSIQLRNLCDTGGDVSWNALQATLLQCLVLEPDQNNTDAQETFRGKFSEADVSTWFYDFVKKHDNDVFDAARIHGPEINEVIQFVGNNTVDFHVFSKAVSSSSDLLDIGMIRFPTEKEPYVKLYRLQLRGTFAGSRFMMVFTSEEERTLTATVSSRKYYPRDELLQCIQSETIQKTLTTFEDMLTE